mgnify:CR=1 FL=1
MRRNDRRKKVLILVGGGVYGCIPAHFLAMLPEGQADLNDVDCLSGCSIGGIMAAAYGIGHSFQRIDYFFQQEAEKCFCKRTIAKFNPLACPTYSSDQLQHAVSKLLGCYTLGETRLAYPQLDIFIPTLNITKDKYKVFDNISDRDVRLSTVAMMTSAAPSYFSGVSYKGDCYIDGGLIEVAPLLTATTALKGKRRVPFSDMDVLMLGTGKDVDEKPLNTDDYNGLGLLGMATKVIVPYVTLSNELATVYWGQNMGFNSFTYFNPCVHDGKLDDASQVPAMIEQCDKYREEFLETYNRWISG